LFDDKNSQKGQLNPGIAPKMFKHLVGKGHAEFSTGNQQDALEYFQHFVTQLERNSKKLNEEDLTNIFKFETEERIECLASSKVNYKNATDFILPFQIPLKKASNKTEYEKYLKDYKSEESEFNKIEDEIFNKEKEKNNNYIKKVFKSSLEVVQPIIDIQDCIDAYLQPEIIEDFYSSAIDGKTNAKKFLSFF
jgi:ubiquitin carboxyl-terminal hydrolase 5/13